MIEHHIKYKEIHGYDETVLMTRSDHTKLHTRLRKEGKCNISSEELKRISIQAYKRTEKGKEAHKIENKAHYQRNKDTLKAEGKERSKEYYKNNKEGKIKVYRDNHKTELAEYQKAYRKRKLCIGVHAPTDEVERPKQKDTFSPTFRKDNKV